MNNKLQITNVLGKELSSEDIKTINTTRLQEFGSKEAINPQPNNDDWTKVYFLEREKEYLVAFGRLHNVTITFRNADYHIFGIATVVALEKGKGYGKLLLNTMQTYIQKAGKTGIGFCNQKITPFYKKCGFGIIPDGQKRFEYSKQPRFTGSDAIYIKGEDGLVNKMLEFPNETAHLSRPHW